MKLRPPSCGLAAQEIIGAAGCVAPGEISADMIFRRESGVHVRSYADLHERYFPMLPCAARRLLSRERARCAARRRRPRRALSGTKKLRPAFPSTLLSRDRYGCLVSEGLARNRYAQVPALARRWWEQGGELYHATRAGTAAAGFG